jgi:two-component system cell cycle response regulator DivK
MRRTPPMPTLVLAEDDPYGIMLFKDVLTKAGYHVLDAANGAEALELIRRQKPDLVLMDIRMPVMSGLDAIRSLKADPELCTIPVVAVTVCVMKEEQRAIREAGADAFLSKPCSIKELLAAVKSQLETAAELQCRETPPEYEENA